MPHGRHSSGLLYGEELQQVALMGAAFVTSNQPWHTGMSDTPTKHTCMVLGAPQVKGAFDKVFNMEDYFDMDNLPGTAVTRIAVSAFASTVA